MSEAIHDPHAYTRLTDHVVQRVLESSDPLLAEVSVVGRVSVAVITESLVYRLERSSVRLSAESYTSVWVRLPHLLEYTSKR